MTTALIVCSVFFACLYGGTFAFSGPVYLGPVSDHFDGTQFFNHSRNARHDFKTFLSWVINRNRGSWQEHLSDTGPEPAPPARVDRGRLLITPVGHATFLIQLDGINILTDPIWSERASPVAFTGPRRVHAPGMLLKDLPPLDAILISHNHYDHLDIPTLRRIAKIQAPQVVTSLGNKPLLTKTGLTAVTELDWWEAAVLPGGMRITCVPAQHFSGRGMRDTCKTLWAGFVLESAGGAVYFAGDTGYAGHFQEINKRFGPIRLALLPIGAYKPEWFMWPGHMGPKSALKAHGDLQAQTSIAMHFGVFPLGDDGQHEARDALAEELQKTPLNGTRFLVPQWGRQILIP